MHKYEIIIYWSNEDDAYVAQVPELPGCTAHGNTYKCAAAYATEAIQLWIDTAKEFGGPIPTQEASVCSPMYAARHPRVANYR